MTEIANVTFALGRVTTNDGLARDVRLWHKPLVNVSPKQQVVGLLLHRQHVVVGCVQKNMRVRLVVWFAEIDKRTVMHWHVVHVAAVGLQSLLAAVEHPEFELATVLQPVVHHDFVVAKNRNQGAHRNQLGHDANDTGAVWASVDVIAQRDDGVC